MPCYAAPVVVVVCSNYKHRKCRPRVYIPSRITEGIKVVPVAQVKQAGIYSWQQQNRTILELDDPFIDPSKGIISHCVEEYNGKHSYFSPRSHIDRWCEPIDDIVPDDGPLMSDTTEKVWGSFQILMVFMTRLD